MYKNYKLQMGEELMTALQVKRNGNENGETLALSLKKNAFLDFFILFLGISV